MSPHIILATVAAISCLSVLPATAAASIDVALVSAENVGWPDDVRAKLEATGFFSTVDMIEAGAATPTLAKLQLYASVLVWSNAGFQDAELLGDRLADYVDGGGGVVLATFANACVALNGRYVADDYGSIATGVCNGGAVSFVPDLSQHPLLVGVSSFDAGFQRSAGPLLSGALQVAGYSNGLPAVAVRDVSSGRTVDLNFYPISTDQVATGWDATTDGARLIANALLHAAQSPVPLPVLGHPMLVVLVIALTSLTVTVLWGSAAHLDRSRMRRVPIPGTGRGRATTRSG